MAGTRGLSHVVLLLAAVAAQGAQAPKVTYAGDELKIVATDANLEDILSKVAALTGVTIELPAGASTARLSAVELGPGPAAQVLASLLSDSNLDYLIQASDTSPGKIKSVLVMKREKKGPELPLGRNTGGAVVASNTRAEEPPVIENPVPVEPEKPRVEEAATNAAVLTPADSSTPLTASQAQAQSLQSSPSRTAPLSPPPSLSTQSINQQLQQMYEQRMQITQQTAPANPVIK